jgi:response regulator RpfG family c-di-GMP phosphodiesterase
MVIKILIVDDESNVARSVNRLLRGEGFETFVAQSGDEALKILSEESGFSVIVSDQRMPKMTGVELFEKMRVEYPLIKRILLTGYTNLDSLRTAVNTGNIFRFLLKPWDDDELIMCVKDAAAAHQLEIENIALNAELKTLNDTLEQRIEQKTRVLSMNLNALERYEDMIEQMPVGMICVSEEDMVVLANKSALKILGFSAALEGLNYQSSLPSGLVESFEKFLPNQQGEIELNNQVYAMKTSLVTIKDKFFGRLICLWKTS